MPRIYLECSQTAINLHRTGIQRVVRNLVLNHVKAAHAVGVEASAAQFFGNQFFPFAWLPANDSAEASWGESLKHRISGSFDQTNAVLARVRKAVRLRKVRRRYRSLRSYCRSLWLSRFAKPLRPRPGDLMVLVDYTWGLPIWPAVENWRRQGGKVAFVIYDILPITNPEFFLPKISQAFAEWFEDVCRNADLLLAISVTVRDQLRARIEFDGDIHLHGAPQIESFALGAELDMWHSDAHVRSLVRAASDPSTGQPPYLMVGTIEPRKNHMTVLDAFERLWDRGRNVRLIVVGRPGWEFDAVKRRLLTHPRFGRDLYWFADLSDTELEHCYRHAKAVILASWGEGFGLPIVEGLQHGLPVIASDLPVHREVAGDFAAYFDPAQPDALAAWIERFETLGELPGVSPAKDFRPVSWYEGTKDLLQRCRDFMQGPPKISAENRNKAT